MKINEDTFVDVKLMMLIHGHSNIAWLANEHRKLV